jgi:hypothetical protein
MPLQEIIVHLKGTFAKHKIFKGAVFRIALSCNEGKDLKTALKDMPG